MDEELHNHIGNAEKFKGALDADATIYQHREQKTGLQQFKELHGKEKRQFFRDYYLRIVLVVLAVAVLVVYFIYSVATNSKYALNILAVNAYADGNEEFEEEYFNDFMDRYEIDSSKYEIFADRSIYVSADTEDYSDYASVEKLMTLFAAGEVDLCMADIDYFEYMAGNDFIDDLGNYLTEEEIAAVDEDDLVYVRIVTLDDDEEEVIDERTILAGIRLDTTSGWLHDMGWYYEGMDVAVGISVSMKNEEYAIPMLREILAYE